MKKKNDQVLTLSAIGHGIAVPPTVSCVWILKSGAKSPDPRK